MITVSWMPEIAHTAVDAVGMEVIHLACFVFGFAVFNTPLVQQLVGTLIAKPDAHKLKHMTSHFSSGKYMEVLEMFQTLAAADLTEDVLRMVTEALVELGRAAEAAAVVSAALARQSRLRTPACEQTILEAVVSSSVAARGVHEAFLAAGVATDETVATTLMQVYSRDGDADAVRGLLSTHGFACPSDVAGKLVDAALASRDLDAAAEWIRASGPEKTSDLLTAAAQDNRADICTDVLQRQLPTLSAAADWFAAAQTAAAATVLLNCVHSLPSLRRRSVVTFEDRPAASPAAFTACALEVCPEADALLAALQAAGKVDAECYQGMISRKIAIRAVGAAWALWSEMDSAGFVADAATAESLLRNLRPVAADVDNALRLLPALEQVQEPIVTTVLDACIRLKDVQRLRAAAAALRTDMQSHHVSSVLKAYGRARATDLALALWQEVAPAGPDVVAAAVEAFVANGQVGQGFAVLSECGAPSATYHLLIKACVVHKAVETAWQVHEHMEERGVAGARATFSSLIDLCARDGRMDRAGALFRAMCTAGMSPDQNTYAAIVKGYCMQGELEQAIQLFTFMRARGVKPDAMLFNAILDGCARRDMVFMAEQVLSDMDDFGVAPSNATLCILVKLYGKVRDVDAAFRVVEELPARYGFAPDDKVLSALVGACLRSGRLAAAADVFGRLEQPDAKVYGRFIHGHLQHDDVQTAVDLVTTAVGVGVDLAADTVDSVLFLADRRGLGRTVPAKVRRWAAGRVQSSRDPSPSSSSSDGDARSLSTYQQRRLESQRWRDA